MMDTINLLREAMTVISFLAFMGVVYFAMAPGNKKRFEEAANLVFDEDDK